MSLAEKSLLFLATGCKAGTIPFMPGTMGSVVGLPLCYLRSRVSPWAALGLSALLIALAVWMAHGAEKILKREDPDRNDPGCIVIDEIAGISIALLGLPFKPLPVALGFVLFRGLDILKPFPIRWLERSLPGGIGIVADDVAAGVAANLVLRVVLVLTPVAFLPEA